MDNHKDPFYELEQKEKETRDLLFTVITENARLTEDNKRLRKEKKMSKMRSKDEILGGIVDGLQDSPISANNPAINCELIEVLVDIRDILDKKMSKIDKQLFEISLNLIGKLGRK